MNPLRDKPWSVEDLNALRLRHAQGETFSEIGEALGRTPNACIGKATRLGLVQRDRAAQHRRGFQRLVERRAQELSGR